MIPLLRRLDRYVMGQFLKVLIISEISLTMITITVHLMDHIDVYLDANAQWLDVARHYALQVPYNMLLTLPMAMLIATILTIGEMGRHGELTAMKASGLSLFRMSSPLVAFAFLASLGVLAINETWVPDLNEKSNRIYEEEILGRMEEYENYRGNFVYQNSTGHTYIVRSLFVEDSASSGDQVEIQRVLDDGTFVRINAPQMLWEGSTGVWVLKDGEMRVFPGHRTAPDSAGAADSVAAGDSTAPRDSAAVAAARDSAAAVARAAAAAQDSARGIEERMFSFQFLRSPHLDDTPQELLVRERNPEEMGYRDLEEYVRERDRLGADTRKERVDLHMKLAYPFANLVIVLFGIGLVGSAAHAGRKSATAGFGVALFLTIVFWGFLRVGQGVGYGGGLPPFWAAWLANVAFLSVGLVLLARART